MRRLAIVALALLAGACTASGSTELTASTPARAATSVPASPEVATPTPPPPTATPPAGPNIALFNVAGDNDYIRPFNERAPAPFGAIPAFSLNSNFEPREIEGFDAAADSARQEDQIVVPVDLSGCVLMTLWALPQPDQLLVGFEWADVDCEIAVEYHGVFLIDVSGSNSEGTWDYTTSAPPVVLEEQRVGR